jgi:LEA14-like dessication related protein
VAYADLFKAAASLRNEGEAKTNLSLETEIPIPSLSGLKNVVDIPGTLPILQKPEISFRGITRKSQISAMDLLLNKAMEFELTWEVENKNVFDFGIGEFVYDFSLNNSRLAQGRVNTAPQLKAGSKTVIPLVISVSPASIASGLFNLITQGASASYGCTGNMVLQSSFPGLDKLELPLNIQGNTRIQ